MLFSIIVTAVAVTPDLSTNSGGWLGTGLLGTVLAWLCLVHLPAKDKQLQKLIDDKDAQINKILGEHLVMEREQRREFLEALKAERMDFKTALAAFPQCRYLGEDD